MPAPAKAFRASEGVIQTFLAPLLDTSENSDWLVAGAIGQLTNGRTRLHIPRFIFMVREEEATPFGLESLLDSAEMTLRGRMRFLLFCNSSKAARLWPKVIIFSPIRFAILPDSLAGLAATRRR